MSGGSYDYFYHRIDEYADTVAVRSSNPLRKAFASHCRKVARAAKAIEWNDSGDGDDNEEDLIRLCVSPSDELKEATDMANVALRDLLKCLGKESS